jgi:hypothetical protein
MKIEVETNEAETGNEADLFARYCAGFELGPFRTQIGVVRINLSRVREASSGKDKCCSVEVELLADENVFAEAVDSNPFVAIHWALEQAGWTISCRQQREPSSLPITGRYASAYDESDRAA